MACSFIQLQHVHLDAILGPDETHFESLIAHLMSRLSEQRSHVESIFNFIRQKCYVADLKLLNVISLTPRVEYRAMCFVLLRKCLNQGDLFVWPKLSYATQACIKGMLFICIQREEQEPIFKKLCDSVTELASAILPENGWPELLPFMFKCVASDSVKLQELAFLIFAQLAEKVGEVLLRSVDVLHLMFLQTLSNSLNLNVRVTVLSAVVKFVEFSSSQGDREKFQDLLPMMMKVLTEALNSGQEAIAREALELFIELAENDPRFFRKQIVDALGAMLLVVEVDSLEEGTRHLAIEFMITLAEAKETTPGMIKKFSPFISRLFGTLLKMLLDIDDNIVWHSAEVKHEAAGETNNYSISRECLNRLSIALGGNTIVPVASDKIAAYFLGPEWQKQHAALIAIAQIAEGCSKFPDAHPRVRWASINTIGHFSIVLGPDFQEQYHSQVLPVLAAAMDDFQSPRIQAHAASAIVNFCENCTAEIFLPYLGSIVSKLLVLVQNVKQMVQQEALVALAYVANLSKEHFQTYYDCVMSSLKVILVNANDKSNHVLRAKAIDCISLVVVAVGKDKSRDDAKQVMEVLMSIQGSEMETDDPTAGCKLQAWARLCSCLGEDFLPYLSVVMPPLLRSAQLKPDIIISSTDSESDDDRLASATLRDKGFGIKTSIMEEKATACKMLYWYVHELKERFYPWIDQVLQTLVPLLEFHFPEEFRRAAVSVLPELLHSAKLAVEKGIAQGRDETYVKQLSDYIIPTLVEALHKETGGGMCTRMLNAVNKCLKIGEILGKLIETFKEAFLPFFDEFSLYLMPMWGNDKTNEERMIAICIFDDAVEHCREAALKYYGTYIPLILEACNDESSDVRQGAAYELGICAEYGGSVFKPFVREALSRLDIAMGPPDALQPDYLMAYDNAVSALGKICQFHRDSIDSAQVFPAWLNCLPIRADITEAKAVHDQLCFPACRSDRELLGPNNQYLPKIVSVFVEVLCSAEDLASEQTLSRMTNLLRQLQQTLPHATLASICSSLQPQQQIALQSILSSQSRRSCSSLAS
ncbi:unnamed protein product [Withania somnifera]